MSKFIQGLLSKSRDLCFWCEHCWYNDTTDSNRPSIAYNKYNSKTMPLDSVIIHGVYAIDNSLSACHCLAVLDRIKKTTPRKFFCPRVVLKGICLGVLEMKKLRTRTWSLSGAKNIVLYINVQRSHNLPPKNIYWC